jgi:hypothetical protein
MTKYDTITSVDKLILCYKINSNIGLDQNYIDKFYNPLYSTFVFGNNIVMNESDSDPEKTLKCAKRLDVFSDNVKIGIIYYENVDRSIFYFKVEKELLIKYGYKISDIISKTLTIFPLNYQINNITRLDIAADTTGLAGSSLYVIQDLCQANYYFSNLEKIDQESINVFGGRTEDDAKYQTYGSLKISVNEDGVVHLGGINNWKFIRSYNKSFKSEAYQKLRFIEEFGTDDNIYRLEVSLNNEGCRKEKVNLNKLDDQDYLTYLFKKSVKDYLTFSDLKIKPTYVKGNKVYSKIRLVEDMKFKYPGNPIDNGRHDYEPSSSSLSQTNIVNSNRSKLSNKIRKYFETPESNSIAEILNIVNNKQLNYSGANSKRENIEQAISQVNKMVKRLKSYSIQSKTDLINEIQGLIATNNQIVVTKDLITRKQKLVNEVRQGISLVKIEKLF